MEHDDYAGAWQVIHIHLCFTSAERIVEPIRNEQALEPWILDCTVHRAFSVHTVVLAISLPTVQATTTGQTLGKKISFQYKVLLNQLLDPTTSKRK